MLKKNFYEKDNRTKTLLNLYNNNINTNFYGNLDFILFMNREVYLNNITPAAADDIDKMIRFWNNSDNENTEPFAQRPIIKIYINSNGGSLDAAFTIIDAIKNSKTPVYTINTGVCQKEALYPYLAGHKRYAYPRSSFCFEKDLSRLDFSEGQSNYEDFIKKQNNELKDMLIENTKITDNDYENRKTWWITADKANELKICNEVLRGKFI